VYPSISSYIKLATLLFGGLFVLGSCRPEETYPTLEPSIMWKILPDTSISVFSSGLSRLGLSKVLNNPGNTYTVFPVANQSLRLFFADTSRHEGFASIAELGNDLEMLSAIMNYHLVPAARLTIEELRALPAVNTVQGTAISISALDDGIKLNDKATTTAAQQLAVNGAIHTIDSLLIPAAVNIRSLRQTIKADTSLSTFYRAIERVSAGNATIRAYFNGTSSLRTVFAPANAAFADYFRRFPGDRSVTAMALPKLTNLVNFLILQAAGRRTMTSFTGASERTNFTRSNQPVSATITGSPFRFGTANVLTPDVNTFRGVVHVIDAIPVPSAGF